LAVCVPVVAAYSIGVLAGALRPTASHYLEHAYPAMAVVLAVPLATIGSRVWEFASGPLLRSAYARRTVLWVVPLFFSLNAIWAQPGPARLQPHWADVQALADLLHDDWQWDWLTVERELRSPDKRLVLNDLSASVPGWKTADDMAARRPPEPIVLIQVDTRRIPNPLPRGWIVVSRRTLSALLAIPASSSLDWGNQTACVEDQQGRETCLGSPIDPRALGELRSQPEIRRYVLRVPWRGTAGRVEAIVMPRLPLTCLGRIVQGPPGTEIDPGGRSARVTRSGEVIFEWIPNGPNCQIWDFYRLDDPPFIIAGEPDTVDFLSQVVDQGRS
jgi:hypothetical protein